MKLRRLAADGFGPLRGTFTFDPRRVTLVVDDNERGKSSLLAAIAAALYGLGADKRTHRVVTPIDRWRPWDGGAYRLELEVEHDGEVLTVRRDFERGTVEVWNDRGQDVTESFREGRDEFPIGRRLLGLDAEEFEKCALVRQHELDLVVPNDERARRAGTLHARLENAADTRAGDGTASEAVQVLQDALKRYTCPELSSTLTIDNAIKALEAKRGIVDTELAALDHDLARVAGPMEELARLSEQEAASRETLARLDVERRASLAGTIERQLADDGAARAELEALRHEAAELAACAHLPANAEGELRETVARLTEAQSQLATLEARGAEQQALEREELEKESAALARFEGATAADADRLVALAAELRRIEDSEQAERDAIDRQHAALAARGWDFAKLERLAARFGALDPAARAALDGQSTDAAGHHAERDALERTRAGHTESLRQIDAARGARRLPGWFLLALGIGALIAGIAVLALQGLPAAWGTLLGLGVAMMGGGLVLLRSGQQLRALEREEVLRGLTDTQRRLNELRTRRAEGELAVAELARTLGHPDLASLLREYAEFQRLAGEAEPVVRAGERLAEAQARREAIRDEVAGMRSGGEATADPDHLERLASGIRRRVAVAEQLEALAGKWSWMTAERRNGEATVHGLHEKAVRILQSAGLVHDPEHSWADHVRELAERVRGGSRLDVLERELIPRAMKRVLDAPALADLRARLAAVRGEHGGGLPPARRTAETIDDDARLEHERLDALQQRRSALRAEVDAACHRHAEEEPAKRAERAALEAALQRARDFKAAVELAASEIQAVAEATHRRWADFLNRRVAELLATFGTRVEQLRFGDDLDFSLRAWNGQPMTRGRAVLQLSAGARDQLHLAVRLAIAEFLSPPGAALPLLLDDPFATSDDARARAGMRLLIEHVAKQHPVVLVTCHRARHERLQSLDPELWQSGVHWVDVTAAERAPRS